ncbi:MAG: hypothetical protein KGJ57_15195 [Sphingomonadales bacterium]|nr:hypothetical protein [Sphingomonadales bacterium]MDE2170750.1 hypothetical protein [Sphingomonadales bacterium]
MNGAFRKKSRIPSLSREAADRQGRILTIAIDALGAGGAMTFLNAQDQHLGARPLDLAIGSPEGFGRVQAVILGLKNR